MGLFQQAVKTYDVLRKTKDRNDVEPLAPIGHIIAQAKIEISVDKDGNFRTANPYEEKIVIPVTEASSGRTSAPAPHPFYESISYLSGKDEKKFSLYTEQLQKWAESEYTDEQINAVLKYVQKKSIVNDLNEAGLLKSDEKGNIKNEKDLIYWNVVGLENNTNRSLQEKYEQYYLHQKADRDTTVCYITGEKTPAAQQHLKGVVSFNGNAKIISANDTSNFTYRGRFANSEQAVSVGYIASQKAHNALKWLAANEGVTFGKRTFICWNPNGKIIPVSPFRRFRPQKENSQEEKYEREYYKKELIALLEKCKKDLGDNEDVVIVSFEAATNGRLSVTYYNELKASDYLERLEYWDETCCWYDNRWGTKSPDLYNIIKYAFGYQRGSDENSKVEVDADIVGQHMQRLINCRVDKGRIPSDIKNNLVNKAERLLLYNKKNKDSLLFTACAVIRKYKIDYEKEEYQMALETEKKDRSYQYGRLLAVLEKIEQDTYDSEKDRTTNALRMQSVFVKRPAYAARIITEQLKNAYYPKLSPAARTYYDKLIGQIMEIISEFGDEEFNKPLTETYLLGYYLQQNALYKKNNKDEEREEN